MSTATQPGCSPIASGDAGKKRFAFAEIRMPTPEEHRATSLKWLARIQPTLIDQWPPDLAALSMPTKLVQIDAQEVLEGFGDMHDGKGIPKSIRDLASRLDDELEWRRMFVRLNSRSPKDAPWPFEIPVTLSGRETMSIFCGSERILDDLLEFKYVPEQPAYVCLRQFHPEIQPRHEYRCFVKEGKLIAVTHYDYLNPHAGPEDGGKELRTRIDSWFAERMKPTLHIDTVVFDICIGPRGDALLIEINPYGASDPCHFGDYASVERSAEFVRFSSLHREAISEPPCGAAVTPHPVAPNTQEEGSP
jgi:hypothetical protein